MKIRIKGQAYNRKTGEKIGIPRWEVIDTETNSLFVGVESLDVAKSIFESFWNDLNPMSKEVVRCVDIK